MRAIFYLTIIPFFISCSDFPRDPKSSFKEITGDTLKVGVSESYPWTIVSDDRSVTGIEAEVVQMFADSLGVPVRFIEGPETEIINKLKNYKLHLVIAGLNKNTVWENEIGLTFEYLDKHVMAVPKGENRLLMNLELFLRKKKPEIRSLKNKYRLSFNQ